MRPGNSEFAAVDADGVEGGGWGRLGGAIRGGCSKGLGMGFICIGGG